MSSEKQHKLARVFFKVCLAPAREVREHTGAEGNVAANLCTQILDFRGLDSSIILILTLRGLILMSKGDFPESLSQAILVGIILVGRLGIRLAPAREVHGQTGVEGNVSNGCPVPAGSRIKRLGSVRFGWFGSVSYSFLEMLGEAKELSKQYEQ